ncbi:DUF4349 domain-containing protein [Epilithonimonas sp. UC225_85]|uniref:DUF4349 domain-containing protein n=1 Tax=Epilithonimonas sp. UC225_85 TaxID=3350167 RepID=UPI0036D3C56D
MKKLILTAAVLSTLTMCKKADLEQANNTISSTDSLVDKVSENVEKFDSAANTIVDSVNLKAKDLIKNKEEIEKAFDNSKQKIDSIADDVAKFKKDIDDKKISSNIDSVKNSIKKEISKPGKEIVTKIIYKNRPKEIVTPKPSLMVKKGSLEINVDDISTAKYLVQNEIRKYDGTVKTENLISNDEFQTYYITAKVPLQKFDYLLEDLANLGIVKNKNVEIIGDHYSENRLCSLAITLYENNNVATIENEKDKSFGERSVAAISSGWNVIGGILLFLLPFWPLFLIAGFGYYFYKKKKSKTQDQQENKETGENL